jgi:hypothetical protein
MLDLTAVHRHGRGNSIDGWHERWSTEAQLDQDVIAGWWRIVGGGRLPASKHAEVAVV